ncbi:activating signal cointegrator 1 complex subunit 1 [Tanacetum coccineum]
MRKTIVIEGASPSPDSIARLDLNDTNAVKSSALDYSHFISLPLAIHPQLVDKLVNFQNSILGINDATIDEVNGGQKLDEASQVAVTENAQEEIQNVKVDVTKVPLVSYPPKSSATSSSRGKASTLSGKWKIYP